MKKTNAQLAVNGLIIVAAMAAVFFLSRKFIFVPSPAPQPELAPEEVKVGDHSPLTGVDWAKNGETLVIAMSAGCDHCTASIPFYQKLVALATPTKGPQIVAVLPQEEVEGRDYLDREQLKIANVQKVDFDDLKIRATPTLMLVDRTGTVSKVWVGELKPENQDEVITTLGLNKPTKKK